MEVNSEFKNKIPIIKEANDKIFNSLLKNSEITNNIIFVYTPPKVGSTSLVSSIRICASHKFSIIHLHDEIMLRFFTGINNVTINEIIKYNSYIGKNVYVIDVYRTPVERKMSEFFEKISPYHFNNSEENINNYNIIRIINRFNKVFPYLAIGDHYSDKFDIPKPVSFNFSNKYLSIKDNNVNYIKLRLKDSHHWGEILTKLLNTEIIIIKDYQTDNKVIGSLYKKFKDQYRLPCNYLEIIKNDTYLLYYYSEQERNEYLNMWSQKTSINVDPYTEEEYKFYVNLYMENQVYNDCQLEHYIDNGCLCQGCSLKRCKILENVKKCMYTNEKIIHNVVINEINNNKQELIKTIISHKIKKKEKHILKTAFKTHLNRMKGV